MSDSRLGIGGSWFVLALSAPAMSQSIVFPFHPLRNECVDVSSNGVVGNQDSGVGISMSTEGRLVAFSSRSSNLVPNDGNDEEDVFVHDRVSGVTSRVSVSLSGADADGPSMYTSMSADGRYVAFLSRASNLVSGDTNGRTDVFVRDRWLETTERVNVSTGGIESVGDTLWFSGVETISPAISADGRFVAFISEAGDLIPADPNPSFDVFVHDRLLGTTERASFGNPAASPSISADGRFVAFDSNVDANPRSWSGTDVYVRDRLTGTLTLVSATPSGSPGNLSSMFPEISTNGRFVVFHSFASDLVVNDTEGAADLFRRDLAAGTTARIALSVGDPIHLLPTRPNSISADGRFVAFDSQGHVFRYDHSSGSTELVSVNSLNRKSRGIGAVVSADGRVFAFASNDPSMSADGANSFLHVYVRSAVPPTPIRFR